MAMYWAEAEEEAKEALQRPRERWGKIYPKVVTRWEAKAHALLAFLCHPKPIHRYLYITNQLERMSKEIKRLTKVVEKILYLVLSNLNGRLEEPQLRSFVEVLRGSYHGA